MPKTYLDSDKGKWLQSYESGKSEKQIARDAKCDIRTVRRGIEEARLRQEAKVARADLVKDALRKHQDGLLEELNSVLSDVALPAESYVVISWTRGGDYILTESEPRTAPINAGGIMRQLLKKHLKNDRLWKMHTAWQKAYAAHLNAKTDLQRRIVKSIQGKTGCKMVDIQDVSKPFVYAYNTGDLFFRAALSHVLGNLKKIDLENDLSVNTTSGDVRYHSLILAKVPGKEEKTKNDLFAAFGEIKGSTEAISITATYRTLQEVSEKVRQVIERIKLLSIVTGKCEICGRLGM